MKRPFLALCIAGLAAAGLSACADGHYSGAPRGSGVAYYEHGPVGFDGYYDDSYGPFYDGYWGDGGFYYSTGEGRPYQLDRANHFRHDAAGGFHGVHGGVHANGNGAAHAGPAPGGGEHPH